MLHNFYNIDYEIRTPIATLPYIKEKRLDNWSHNKAIQKSIESFRVPKEHKEELKRYKIK